MSTTSEYPSAITYAVWRFCAWSGFIYLVGSLISWVGIAGFVPPPQANWGALQMAAFYRENNVALKAGLVLTLNFQMFYVLFSVAISRVMNEMEGPRGILGTLEMLCGFTNFLITIAGLFFWLTAAFRAETREPAEILLMNDTAWMFLETMFLGTALQYFLFGLCTTLDRRTNPLYPRWMSWFSFMTAASMFPVGLIPFFYSGPFAWHGLISLYYVYAMYFVWIGAASFFTVRAVKRLESEYVTSMRPDSLLSATAKA